jgi:hypothetical protein
MHIKMVTLRIATIGAGIIAVAGAPIVAAAASPSSTGTTPTTISTNEFAGYVAPPGFTSAQATFKVPRLSCGSNSTGLDPDIDLTGPEGLDSEVGAFAQCPGGQWTAYFYINGQQTNSISLTPGSTITVTGSETPKLTELKIKDDTTGSTNALSGTGGTVTDVLIGDEALNGPYDSLPPSRFTTDPFSKVTVGGMSLGEVNATPANWVNGKTTWLSTGAIQGGSAFTLTFQHN